MKEGIKLAIIGPAYPLRGGLATFNERLARESMVAGNDTSIITFALQYPSFLFPGTSQYSQEPSPTDLQIDVCINSINPINWLRVGYKLYKAKADVIVVRYWIPFMAPCLGSILRIVRLNKHTRIVCIADNIIPHEKRAFDSLFTKYFIQPIHSFVAMSEKVLNDVRRFTDKPVEYIPHPVYDTFGASVQKEEACNKLNIDATKNYILFFGFIRKYKGLDLLLQAIEMLKKNKSFVLEHTKLIIAGEFYDDENYYRSLIDMLGIAPYIELKTHFITDSEVRYYFSAADVVVQPYKNATQSGITPLAFYYTKPSIVTNVGGLGKLIHHKKTGLVTEPTVESIAASIEEFYRSDKENYKQYIEEERKKYTWYSLLQKLTAHIL